MGNLFKVADTARMGIFSIDVQFFLAFFHAFFFAIHGTGLNSHI